MVVLVAGATGFIGRSVVNELLLHNYTVRCLVHTPGSERVFPDRAVEIYYGDVRNKDSLKSACRGVEFVINLVSAISPPRASDMLSINIEGVANLVSTIENEHSVKRLVHVSVLGANDNPRERYFFAKWRGEQEIKRTNVPYTIIRPSVIIGASDRFSNVFAGLVRRFPVIPVFGHGRNRVQPMAVDDFAYCIVASLNRQDLQNTTIELGGDLQLSINEIIDSICSTMNRRRIKMHFPLWMSRLFCPLMNLLMAKPILNTELAKLLSIRNVTDTDVAKSVFGITPRGFSEGIDYLTQIDVATSTNLPSRNVSNKRKSPSNEGGE